MIKSCVPFDLTKVLCSLIHIESIVHTSLIDHDKSY